MLVSYINQLANENIPAKHFQIFLLDAPNSIHGSFSYSIGLLLMVNCSYYGSFQAQLLASWRKIFLNNEEHNRKYSDLLTNSSRSSLPMKS